MESVQRMTHLLMPISITQKCFFRTFNSSSTSTRRRCHPILATFHTTQNPKPPSPFNNGKLTTTSYRLSHSRLKAAGWFGLGANNKKPVLPDIVKAGDPVLHEPAQDVPVTEIASDKIQKIIDDMINVMRNAPGVGLAAPQIGIPLKIIVLEDTEEYISYAREEETQAQDRRAFDLLVIVNPKLEKKSDKTALFFEGCLSVDGFRALVERYLEVEVTGFDRDGQPIRVDACGWQARILQHECDHLGGTIYVDKFVPKTFRTVENLDLPLPAGCPEIGAC